MRRLTDDELTAAFDRRDWQALWLQGLAAVRPALRRLVRDGHLRSDQVTDDALQQARLCVGESLQRWRPLDGAFGPWLTAIVYWRMLTWLSGEGSRLSLDEHSPLEDEHSPELEGDDAIDAAVYEEPPEGFGDPGHEASRVETVAAVRAGFGLLRDPQDRHALRTVYGLDGDGGMSIDEYALLMHIPRRTAYRLVERARRNLAQKLGKAR